MEDVTTVTLQHSASYRGDYSTRQAGVVLRCSPKSDFEIFVTTDDVLSDERPAIRTKIGKASPVEWDVVLGGRFSDAAFLHSYPTGSKLVALADALASAAAAGGSTLIVEFHPNGRVAVQVQIGVGQGFAKQWSEFQQHCPTVALLRGG